VLAHAMLARPSKVEAAAFVIGDLDPSLGPQLVAEVEHLRAIVVAIVGEADGRREAATDATARPSTRGLVSIVLDDRRRCVRAQIVDREESGAGGIGVEELGAGVRRPTVRMIWPQALVPPVGV